MGFENESVGKKPVVDLLEHLLKWSEVEVDLHGKEEAYDILVEELKGAILGIKDPDARIQQLEERLKKNIDVLLGED